MRPTLAAVGRALQHGEVVVMQSGARHAPVPLHGTGEDASRCEVRDEVDFDRASGTIAAFPVRLEGAELERPVQPRAQDAVVPQARVLGDLVALRLPGGDGAVSRLVCSDVAQALLLIERRLDPEALLSITDFRHYLTSDLRIPDDLPGPVLRLARFQGAIVGWATIWNRMAPVDTNVACRRRPARRPCSGNVQAAAVEDWTVIA
ncbi:MAG: hypothetical protein U5K81_08350 [Trueperaceae bacterium]|nr:hypothetical protein [Trueperaceae bacterium]